jgi:hypothetical protein
MAPVHSEHLTSRAYFCTIYTESILRSHWPLPSSFAFLGIRMLYYGIDEFDFRNVSAGLHNTNVAKENLVSALTLRLFIGHFPQRKSTIWTEARSRRFFSLSVSVIPLGTTLNRHASRMDFPDSSVPRE